MHITRHTPAFVPPPSTNTIDGITDDELSALLALIGRTTCGPLTRLYDRIKDHMDAHQVEHKYIVPGGVIPINHRK